MVQKKVKEVEKEFEYVRSCQKDELCFGKRGAGAPAKERDGGDAFLILLAYRLP